MDCSSTYLRVTVSDEEQLSAVLSFLGGMVFLDSMFIAPEAYETLCGKIRDAGWIPGLKLPEIWRTEAEQWFAQNRTKLRAAGFAAFLSSNAEGLLCLQEAGLLEKALVCADHGLYCFNAGSAEALTEILGMQPESITLPLELNAGEMRALRKDLRKMHCTMVVYGHLPMMLSAGCIRKTTEGCDHRMELRYLKDRTGAQMPVRNSCTFCCNVIYNSVPTRLYDLEEDIRKIAPDSVRYDFTVEKAAEVRAVLSGEMKKGAFTRGYLKRGVL